MSRPEVYATVLGESYRRVVDSVDPSHTQHVYHGITHGLTSQVINGTRFIEGIFELLSA